MPMSFKAPTGKPARDAAEAAVVLQRQEAERRDRSVRRWALALATVCAVLAFFSLQHLREAVQTVDAPPAAVVAEYVVEAISGGTPEQARDLKASLMRELLRLGLHNAGSGRTVRIEVMVSFGEVGEEKPGEYPVRLELIVREGGRRLGTVTASNNIPAEYDHDAAWVAIIKQGAPVAVTHIAGVH